NRRMRPACPKPKTGVHQEEAVMNLTGKLDAIRAQAETRIPQDARDIMHRQIEELRASGIVSRVAKAGDRAPDFTLTSASGEAVSLGRLLARGPVVLSFFRGRW